MSAQLDTRQRTITWKRACWCELMFERAIEKGWSVEERNGSGRKREDSHRDECRRVHFACVLFRLVDWCYHLQMEMRESRVIFITCKTTQSAPLQVPPIASDGSSIFFIFITICSHLLCKGISRKDGKQDFTTRSLLKRTLKYSWNAAARGELKKISCYFRKESKQNRKISFERVVVHYGR